MVLFSPSSDQSKSSVALSSKDECVKRLASLWEKTQLKGAHSFPMAMTQQTTPHRKVPDQCLCVCAHVCVRESATAVVIVSKVCAGFFTHMFHAKDLYGRCRRAHPLFVRVLGVCVQITNCE